MRFCSSGNSKIMYTRALLLELKVWRKLPRDFDVLILRELEEDELSVDDFVNLEEQLENALIQTRKDKTRSLLESISSLHHEVLSSLTFDEDLGKPERSRMDKRAKNKKSKKKKRSDEPNQMPDNERKKTRKEMMLKTREEVMLTSKLLHLVKILKSEEGCRDRHLQLYSKYFSHLKTCYTSIFRILSCIGCILKSSPSCSMFGWNREVLSFSDLDFMADLMHCLRKLAGNGSKLGDLSGKASCQLTVFERLRCCIVAFKVMKNNLDAPNIDLQEFFVQFYNLILEYRLGRKKNSTWF